MISRPEGNDVWYEKLRKSTNDENIIKNLKLSGDGLPDSECMVLSKDSKLDPKFSINVGDCTKKHSVVCRLEVQKINALTMPGKFPCLAQNPVTRRERSANDKENGKKVENKGL